MIRLFHPLFKLWSKKISDINWFNQEVSGINPATLTCPYCGAEGTCISCHHPYHRYLVYLGPDNRPVSAVVKVPRVECTSCGHTHALLPCPVIPFGSYSLPFIFRILFLYFTHSMTIEELCARGGFSHSTLYKWKQCFLSHKKMYLDARRFYPVAFCNGCRLFPYEIRFLFSAEKPHAERGVPSRPSGAAVVRIIPAYIIPSGSSNIRIRR